VGTTVSEPWNALELVRIHGMSIPKHQKTGAVMIPSHPHSREALAQDLRRLGVRTGDTVMVHASLRAIGPVEGGPGGVLDALEEAVGPQGTLLMILSAKNDWAWVNDRPEPERAELLAMATPFDAARTPANPDMGYLAESFRLRSGTQVTHHPEARFGARGRLAHELLTGAPWHDAYGPGSPLERLCRAGGYVLRLGADLNTATVLHRAEYLVELPEKRRVCRHYRVLGEHGAEIRHVDCLDDDTGIVDWEGEDYFGLILSDFLGQGSARRGTVGRARSELLEAEELVIFGVRWMSERFR
jgi:aminoglycoside N3'-acetyltransferase